MEEIFLPHKLRKWEIIEEIGAGMFSTVYHVRHKDTDKEAALKMIRYSRDGQNVDPMVADIVNHSEEIQDDLYDRLVEKAQREIDIMDSLKDGRNIVSIYDHIVNESEDETVIYILMEYLQPAQDWFAAREFSEVSVLQLGIQLCNALEACSEKGILHRDLKPENILVTNDGTFKLSDFGVSEETGTGSLSMTPQGTVAYMAPEILKGKPYTMEADIYSLGLILYQLVNRNYLPFISTDKRLITPGDYAHSVECRCRGDKFPIPKDASPELVTILSKACKFDEKQRYHSVAELRKDLQKVKSIMERKESAMSGEKNKNGMAKKIGIILAVFALCGGVAYAAPKMLHKSQPENAPIQESESLKVAETEAATIEEVASSMEETESEKVMAPETEEAVMSEEEVTSEPGTEEVVEAETEEAKEEKRYEIGDTVTGDYYQATLISSVVNHESIPEILYDFDLEEGECFVTYTVEVKNLTGKSQIFKDTNFALYADGEECKRQFPMKEFVNIRIESGETVTVTQTYSVSMDAKELIFEFNTGDGIGEHAKGNYIFYYQDTNWNNK